MADFEEKMLEGFEKKPVIWWRYIGDIFFIWEHGEVSLKVFIEQVNMFHSTRKFTADYSKEEENILNVRQILLLNLRTRSFLVILTIAKREYLAVKL